MTWPKASLKYVARFAYGDSIPHSDGEGDGPIRVFGSNGPYATCSEANTKSPAIVIGRKGSYGKVTWTQEPCFASDTTFFVDETTTQQHLRWLYYALQTLKLDEGTDEAAVPGLNRDRAYEKVVLVPPLSEQRAIAGYLDRETTKIDALIAEKERLLSLLAEKRRALITQAVTRGLNPDIPMRGSSVEWLGEIPGHWELKRLKFISPEITVGIVVTPAKYYEDSGVPCLRSLNVKETGLTNTDLVYISPESNELLSKSKVFTGDLVAVRSGQPGTTAIVDERFDGANCIDLIVIRRAPSFDSYFLAYFLNSEAAIIQFSEGSGGAIQQHFNIETAKDLLIPLPPLLEQRKIVSMIAAETAKLGRLQQAAERTIDLFHERRAALISAAVTGQIRVGTES